VSTFKPTPRPHVALGYCRHGFTVPGGRSQRCVWCDAWLPVEWEQEKLAVDDRVQRFPMTKLDRLRMLLPVVDGWWR
jgi:hypothetical protein